MLFPSLQRYQACPLSKPGIEESAESRLVILQCAGSVPSVFGEQVNINARKPEDIQKFVNELLTDASFFPGLGRAITRFQRNSQEVVKAATELVKELKGDLPPEKADPNDEWPAYLLLENSQIIPDHDDFVEECLERDFI